MNHPDFPVENEFVSICTNAKYLFEGFVNVSGNRWDSLDGHEIGFTKESFTEGLRRLDEKITIRRTVCAIFEKNQGRPMLIDGLIKSDFSKSLNKTHLYLLIEDGSNQSAFEYEMLERVKFITRPQSTWKLLETSIIVLCQNEFAEYFEDVDRYKLPYPDVVILVINSTTELEQEDTKAFLNHLGKEFNRGNFILVLNNAKREECAKYTECKDCYPAAVRSYIKETGLKIEKNVFKVSTTQKFNERKFDIYKADKYSNPFKDVRQSIENSSDSKVIEERYKEIVKQLKTSLERVQQTINLQMYKSSMNYQTDSTTPSENSRDENIEEASCSNWCAEPLNRNNNVLENYHKDIQMQVLKRNQSINKVKTKDVLKLETLREFIVENAVEKVTELKNFINERIRSCDDFLDTINVNRIKINFKEKVLKDVAVMKNKIEIDLKNIGILINKMEKRNIYPNYLGYYISDSIESKNLKLNMATFIRDINNQIQNSPSNSIKERLESLLDKTSEIEKNIEHCENVLIIFLGTLSNDEFYEGEKNKRWIIKDNILRLYNELTSAQTNQIDLIIRTIHELIIPFEPLSNVS